MSVTRRSNASICSHDFLGRSIARGSFLLWMHHMSDISFNPSFVPDGAPSSVTHDGQLVFYYILYCSRTSYSLLAIILEAGVQWYKAYKAAHDKNRNVVGGVASTVGTSGGWVTGGGHSPLSSTYGLGTYFSYCQLAIHTLISTLQVPTMSSNSMW